MHITNRRTTTCKTAILALAAVAARAGDNNTNSLFFSCDGAKVLVGASPVHGHAQGEEAPHCFGGRSSGDGAVVTMPRLRGRWTQDHSPDSRAPYWGLSCPFEMNHYSCAPGKQEPRSPRAEYARSLQFEPEECRLDPFDNMGFVQGMKGRHLEFMGDSITRQHFISVVCHLLPSVDWAATHTFWAQNHGDTPAPGCTPGTSPPSSAGSWACRRRYHNVLANVRRPNNTACVFLTTGTRVCYRGMLSRGVNQYLRSFASNILVVANAGLHSGQAKYQPVVESLVKKYKSIDCKKRPVLVYREHIAQHFKGNEDGSFARMEHIDPTSSPVLNVPCRARISDKQLQSRVEIERRVLTEASIPLLPVYDSSTDIGCAHIGAQAKGTADCTHFCQPGVPDYWARLLSNLVSRGINWGRSSCAS